MSYLEELAIWKYNEVFYYRRRDDASNILISHLANKQSRRPTRPLVRVFKDVPDMPKMKVKGAFFKTKSFNQVVLKIFKEFISSDYPHDFKAFYKWYHDDIPNHTWKFIVGLDAVTCKDSSKREECCVKYVRLVLRILKENHLSGLYNRKSNYSFEEPSMF